MRRQVLLSGRGIKIFVRAVILVSQKCAAHMMLVKQVSRGMAVVDREHVAALQSASDFTDPVARFQPYLGVLALAQCDALRCKIFRDGASRHRRQNVHKASVAEIDKNLLHRAAVHHHSMHRQRID